LPFNGPPQAILEVDLRRIIEKRLRSYRARYFCNLPEYAGILLNRLHAEQDTENASGPSVGIVVYADSIESVVVPLWARSAERAGIDTRQ
jgi:hypothetical protein